MREDVQLVDLFLGLDRVVPDDLVVESRHLLGGFSVGQIQIFDLRLLDPRPRQEERRVAGQVDERSVEGVAGPGVHGDDLLGVTDDQETRTLLRDQLVGACRVDQGMDIVAIVYVAVEDLLAPEDLALVAGFVIAAVHEARDRRPG